MKIGDKLVLAKYWLNLKLTKNKSLECEWDPLWAKNKLEFSFVWHTKRDHAGPELYLEIPKLFNLNIKIYDHRHWNSSAGRYYLPNEESNKRN